MDKVTRQVSTNHNLFEERGQPKRYQAAEALLLTSLAQPYRWATPAHECAQRSVLTNQLWRVAMN